ncbi:MAG: M48 family metalloprotease [Candidatus Omnitrophota bacterium]
MKKYFLLFTFYFLFLLSGCLSTEYNVATHTQDIFLYSTEKEVRMGRNISNMVENEFNISLNPGDIKRITESGQRIAEVCDRQEISYYFYVIEADSKRENEFNAFSLPGGYVYIGKDLFDLLNDNELSFVLAHEVAHIVSRHHIKKLQAAIGYNLLLAASSATVSGRESSQGLSLALATIMSAYSRQDEFTADELAAKYMVSIGEEPTAGISVLEKLYKENKKKIRPLSYFRTHPYTAERIRHIRETLHLPLSVEDYINF